MQIMIKTTLLISFALLFSGCATFFSGSSEVITISSNPPGASVVIDGKEQGKTPYAFGHRRKLKQTTIELQYDGYESQSFLLGKRFNGASGLNAMCFFCWIVDISTGAIIRYGPVDYHVTMKTLEASN